MNNDPKTMCTRCIGRGNFENYDMYGTLKKRVPCSVCAGTGTAPRVLAAAPEMLELLRDVVDVVQAADGFNVRDGLERDLRALLARIDSKETP